jgi:two-component system, chemotaxis family, protein-glutamate methylesterase/glutaminase
MSCNVPEVVRVLVVDDSPFIRKALTRMLNAEDGIEVVGTAESGEECLEEIKRVHPDVVTLDVMMAGMDGLTALREIMATNPLPVLMLSSLTTEGAEISLWALEVGAVDIIEKPATYAHMDVFSIGSELVAKVRAAASVDPKNLGVAAHPAVPSVERGETHRRQGQVLGTDAEVVVIGASTGGPPALQRIISQLPLDFPAPVVVVQHMPDGFTSALAQRLDAIAALDVKEAEDGDLLEVGRVLLARSGRHLHFERKRAGVVCRLDLEPPGTAHMPSIDVTMSSLSDVFGGRVLGLLLTGMGADGARGLLKLHEAGAHTIVESQESCVIFGMPHAAIELGAADEVLDLSDICFRLATNLGEA